MYEGDGRERPAVGEAPPRGAEGDGHEQPRPPRKAWYRRPLVLVAAAILLGLLVFFGLRYWAYARAHESTDDAAIDGRIVIISAKVAGQIEQLAVTDNQQMRVGQLLVQIDPRPFRAAVEQTRAEAQAAQAAAQNADVDARRAQALAGRGLISRQDLDHALATARTDNAQLAAARERVREAELNLSYTTVRAPEPGRVTQRTAEPGAYVQVGQQVMAIVPREFWVTANFKETQLTHMRPGQPARVTVDAYPGVAFPAHVDSVQSGTGARFSLLPPENATGNFVKVVQRVPVKVVFDGHPGDRYHLGPGMSAEVTVTVGK